MTPATIDSTLKNANSAQTAAASTITASSRVDGTTDANDATHNDANVDKKPHDRLHFSRSSALLAAANRNFTMPTAEAPAPKLTRRRKNCGPHKDHVLTLTTTDTPPDDGMPPLRGRVTEACAGIVALDPAFHFHGLKPSVLYETSEYKQRVMRNIFQDANVLGDVNDAELDDFNDGAPTLHVTEGLECTTVATSGKKTWPRRRPHDNDLERNPSAGIRIRRHLLYPRKCN